MKLTVSLPFSVMEHSHDVLTQLVNVPCHHAGLRRPQEPRQRKDLDCSFFLLQKPVIRRAMLFARSVLAGTELLSARTIA